MDQNLNDEKLAERILFSKEAAAFLGITVQRLNKLVHDGKIKPLKKNPSGTIFLIDDLKKRKEELAIFDEPLKSKGDAGMFYIDSQNKQEALNYATLLLFFKQSEKQLEPRFDEFGRQHDLTEPLPNKLHEYADFFGVNENELAAEYDRSAKAFSTLNRTDEIIKRGDFDYPPLLAATEQAPRFLYIRGRKSLLQEKRTVALVGSRKASEKSKVNTRNLAAALGRNGITVVSGNAAGIDVTAHKTALELGFNTITVIGTNLNQYYPAENKPVQIEIEKRGLVVSQFSPASKTERWFFPLRNGVMSGLSLATVVMEAGETSGALRQADFALKQGREVLIPQTALEMESITWPARYVKRGARTVSSPREVLEALAESNIFQARIPVQETITDYLGAEQKTTAPTSSYDWMEALVGEG